MLFQKLMFKSMSLFNLQPISEYKVVSPPIIFQCIIILLQNTYLFVFWKIYPLHLGNLKLHCNAMLWFICITYTLSVLYVCCISTTLLETNMTSVWIWTWSGLDQTVFLRWSCEKCLFTLQRTVSHKIISVFEMQHVFYLMSLLIGLTVQVWIWALTGNPVESEPLTPKRKIIPFLLKVHNTLRRGHHWQNN